MTDETLNVHNGSPAPDFSLEASDGTIIRLSDYRNNKHVVLYFMREFL
jgi:peroxiredoxin